MSFWNHLKTGVLCLAVDACSQQCRARHMTSRFSLTWQSKVFFKSSGDLLRLSRENGISIVCHLLGWQAFSLCPDLSQSGNPNLTRRSFLTRPTIKKADIDIAFSDVFFRRAVYWMVAGSTNSGPCLLSLVLSFPLVRGLNARQIIQSNEFAFAKTYHLAMRRLSQPIHLEIYWIRRREEALRSPKSFGSHKLTQDWSFEEREGISELFFQQFWRKAR